MTQLSVNVNKVALLRNTRTIGIPSVTKAARTVIEAGAYGVTVHPRPDERHITADDVDDLVDLLGSQIRNWSLQHGGAFPILSEPKTLDLARRSRLNFLKLQIFFSQKSAQPAAWAAEAGC